MTTSVTLYHLDEEHPRWFTLMVLELPEARDAAQNQFCSGLYAHSGVCCYILDWMHRVI